MPAKDGHWEIDECGAERVGLMGCQTSSGNSVIHLNTHPVIPSRLKWGIDYWTTADSVTVVWMRKSQGTWRQGTSIRYGTSGKFTSDGRADFLDGIRLFNIVAGTQALGFPDPVRF